MIDIYDNCLAEDIRSDIYLMAITANYNIGWDDSSVFEHRQYPCLHHSVKKESWEQLNLVNEIQNHELRNKLKELSFVSATINLAVPSSIQFQHTHPQKYTLLYYINMEWKPEYYGETLFFNDLGTEVEYTSLFKPGRIVFFDGKIPHTIRPSSHIAPSYRFTLFASFNEKNFIEQAKNSS
tara:strand:- start:730 stop:1272 length:543 start_codon:yes stop_codon:yes gene_type:complete